MANVLGELFQDIADAIRGKTGEVALLKPNEFAAAIDSIVVGSGDSSGGTIVDGAGNVKFASGRFDTTTAGVYRQTIEHGLGEIPDFVAVFACNMGADASDYAVEDYRLAAIYGASSDYSSKLHGYSAFVNGRGTNANGGKVDGLSWSSIDKEQSDLYSYWHIIQCPNADTFTVGWNDNYSSTATGQYLFLPNTVYRWVAISGIGSVAASDDVRYVTFMNGDTVLYKKAVATGDDCVDVLTKGLIETPTKESDAQYDYTFYGWGAEDGGAADDTILQNITEDKTVYAIFAATVRYYTITWLDDDGVTELPGQTQWAYGTVPSYTPSKTGFSFSNWNPTPVSVTGDASYTAVWGEKITFAGGSWADIAAICAEGKAQEYFALRDERAITINGENLTFFIAGFDHDDLADGSGKASMTLLSKTPLTQTISSGASRPATGTYFYGGNIAVTVEEYFDTLDAELQAIIKPVNKVYDNSYYVAIGDATTTTQSNKLWVPSFAELDYGITDSREQYLQQLGTTYAAMNKTLLSSMGWSNGTWLRNILYLNKTSNCWCYMHSQLSYHAGSAAVSKYTDVGFCI